MIHKLRQLQEENQALKTQINKYIRRDLWIANPWLAAKQDLQNQGIDSPSNTMIRVCINATMFNRGAEDLNQMIENYKRKAA